MTAVTKAVKVVVAAPAGAGAPGLLFRQPVPAAASAAQRSHDRCRATPRSLCVRPSGGVASSDGLLLCAPPLFRDLCHRFPEFSSLCLNALEQFALPRLNEASAPKIAPGN